MPPRSREHPPRRDRKDRLNAFHQRRNLIYCYRPAKKDNFVQPAEEFFAAEGAEKQFAGPVYIPFLRLGRLKCAINIDAHLLAIVKPNDVIPLFKFKHRFSPYAACESTARPDAKHIAARHLFG